MGWEPKNQAIAHQIIEQEGDYVLALKGNHRNLFEDVEQVFTHARQQEFQDIEHDFYQSLEGGHGLIEMRRY